MKVQNKFSKLRLISLVCFFLAVIGIVGSIMSANDSLLTIGIIALVVGFIVRIIRFVYRD